jgi:hypothetical protein
MLSVRPGTERPHVQRGWCTGIVRAYVNASTEGQIGHCLSGRRGALLRLA